MFLRASAGVTSKSRYTQQLRLSDWNLEINVLGIVAACHNTQPVQRN